MSVVKRAFLLTCYISFMIRYDDDVDDKDINEFDFFFEVILVKLWIQDSSNVI